MRARLAAIIGVRLIVASLLLGSGVVIGLTTPDTLPAVPFVGLIGLTYVLSLLNLATLRLTLRLPVLVDLQFAIDAALVSATYKTPSGPNASRLIDWNAGPTATELASGAATGAEAVSTTSDSMAASLRVVRIAWGSSSPESYMKDMIHRR